jgi:small subunit ribosomal protein S20
VKELANIKSSIKRVNIARAKTLKNTMKKSALKTTIKKCKEAINTNSDTASDVLRKATKALDKAASQKVIHKNTAARRKSKLAKALNAAKAAE